MIEAHLPVNTQIGAADIAGLQREITKPQYSGGVRVALCGMGAFLAPFGCLREARAVKSYGGDPASVPGWPDNDFDSIFVVRLRRQNNHVSVSFNLQHEGLNGHLRDVCPGF